MSDNKKPEKSSAKCRDGGKTAVATVSEKTTDKGSCSTTCGPAAADSSGEQASSSSSGGQVGQRKGCHRPKSKAFFYKDTVEHSSSGGESDSSCPKVTDYPVGRDQFTRRSPTSKELEEAWQGSRKEEAATCEAAATGQSDANWSSSSELSEDHYFWEPDEEDLVLEDLRSRFESDR